MSQLNFSKIVAEHQSSVYRYALALTRDPSNAEDVLQETFLAAFKGLEDFRGDAQILTWLLTIARRVAIRLDRRRAGEPRQHDGLDDLGTLGVDAGWGESETPEAYVRRSEERETVRRLLAKLPDLDREVIILRDLEELTSRETARVMDVSEAAVRTRLHRARLRLLGMLRKEESHGK